MDPLITLEPTSIDGVVVARSRRINDSRGSFARWFCFDTLLTITRGKPIVQINHSVNLKTGTLRGMHFQRNPHAEIKLVRCLKGRIWDVALDLRQGSATFLKWAAVELEPSSDCMLVIPEGCAHGFQVLGPDSEVLYLHTAAYSKESEGGIRYNEPRVGISWPLPVTELSDRDANHPWLPEDFAGLV